MPKLLCYHRHWNFCWLKAVFLGLFGMKKCLRLTITGKVQGVGFRTYIKEQAETIGQLEGMAQNMSDGSVVVQVAGPAEHVENLIDQIYKGTPKTKIESIVTEALVSTRDFRGVFRIIG